MKRSFGDKDSHSPTMFPNLHHQPPPPPPHFAINHHLMPTTTSSEAESKKESSTGAANDGASIEVVRRPRGRPPGSKNKPKPPVFVTPKPDPCMSPYVLEIPGGSDIVAAVERFCNHRNTGLCVLSGSGSVSNVSFRKPTSSTAVTFHGVFDLLSISATVVPPSTSAMLIPDLLAANKFVVSLAAGSQAQTIGGAIVGPLIAVGTVYIVAASFNNPLYHRLPVEEDDHVRNSGGGSVSGARDQSPGSGGGDSGQRQAAPSTASESLSMYNCHLPHDVIWAPTPRQPPPHSSSLF